MRPRRTRQAGVLLVLLVAGASCLGRPVPVDGVAPEPAGIDASQTLTDVAATLIVENARMVDYRIYLGRQGGERLGIVQGPGRRTFMLKGVQLPPTGDLRVYAVPIADRQVLVGQATVPRGRTARFRIMPNDAYLIVEALPEPKEPAEPDSTKADSARAPGGRSRAARIP